MAGGTGGHIFPALSIAERLRASGARVEWLGSDAGLEREILGKTDIPLHLVSARGLRGKGLRGLLGAPLMILRATAEALQVIGQVKPDCVLGMGGFVTGPGAVAARIRHRKLLIHEQNAVPGVTNRLLAPLACRVMEAFPDTFARSGRVELVGNPVRQSIVTAGSLRQRESTGPLRVLVLGGSQGAQAINAAVPAALQDWPVEALPEVWHQAGKGKLADTLKDYKLSGINVGTHIRVTEFIDDMAEAYGWADLVICRSGASTVAEIAVAGLPSVLIPYPYHKDQQQLKNARWLCEAGAAIILEQAELTPAILREQLAGLGGNPQRLAAMSRAALDVAITDAADRIARICLEATDG